MGSPSRPRVLQVQTPWDVIMEACDQDSDGDVSRSVMGEALGGSVLSSAHGPVTSPLSSGSTVRWPGSQVPSLASRRWDEVPRSASPVPDPSASYAAVLDDSYIDTSQATPETIDLSAPRDYGPQTPPHRESMESHVDMTAYYSERDSYSDPKHNYPPLDRRASDLSLSSVSLAESIIGKYSATEPEGTHRRVPYRAGPNTPTTSVPLQGLSRDSSLRSAHDDTSLHEYYGGRVLDFRHSSTSSLIGSGDRTKLIQSYAPHAGWASEMDHSDMSCGPSSISLGNYSTDKFVLPAEYDKQVFVLDPDDQLQGNDTDWDERKLRTKQRFSVRGCANVGMLVLLALAILMLFMGYPVLTTYHVRRHAKAIADALGRDPDTPVAMLNAHNVRTTLVDPASYDKGFPINRTSFRDGRPMTLVFSDEFDTPGRSFYPGEDPFWQAENLHYWQTENYEWYDPESITTDDGNLVIRLVEKPEHDLFFRGGLLSSWNKFCFTGGYIEVGVRLPGRNNVSGLWPAVWTMGNLGRAGYGATTDGLWPYSYDACDVGTLPNQTYLASQGGGPLAAETTGHYIDQYGPALSYLPGQRLSRCTCLNSDDHPGPHHPDGSFVGRSAPEIDILEAVGNNGAKEHGQASMSLQVAPFDAAYNISSDPDAFVLYDNSAHYAEHNTYTGSAFQQAVSAKVNTTDGAYQLTDGQFDSYGYEYVPGGGPDAHITWTMSGAPVVTMNATAVGPNPHTEIAQRNVPEEPMYVLINLGIASSFSWVNWDELTPEFPFELRVDYVRVWQDVDKINVGCSPDNFPTADYIAKHIEAYTNPELTSWVNAPEDGGYNHTYPGNALLGQCSPI